MYGYKHRGLHLSEILEVFYLDYKKAYNYVIDNSLMPMQLEGAMIIFHHCCSLLQRFFIMIEPEGDMEKASMLQDRLLPKEQFGNCG